METSWNKTVDGKQYFISINSNCKLEYSFDNVNPLVAGGWTFELVSDLNQEKWIWEEIAKIFGLETARMAYALVLTLDKSDKKDVESKSFKFYEFYQSNFNQVTEKKMFENIKAQRSSAKPEKP